MKRAFYPYQDWEEHHAGMWVRMPAGPRRTERLQQAIAFTGDAALYGLWMLRVVDEWPISCSQNLSSLNRQAWIGHAACCLAIQCPEDVTREAWRFLTEDQQRDANAAADRAIALWEARHREPQLDLFDAQA